ncbi:hypothetical protein F8M41_000188 [Gigaspora margarita]|uniref:F-box domain-containing protein n=1 Tax=Gigaspora margarita TaxID=4874 RepID=A0A8H3XJH8_GIGMA|nr:hypothetical protein F8M41_000188 [Gigaspora margarita]
MAPKILMGDMPELIEHIFKNLNNEISSLYSCALVSRHWCKMSIPILWQNPFSFYQRNPLFISNYFSSLDEYEKIGLKECLEECGINKEFSKTLFDYAKFLRILYLNRLEYMVKNWIDLKPVSYERLINYIINLLLKLFIESGATLHELDLSFSRSFQLMPEIFYSLGRNGQFFSRIQHLSLSIRSIISIESVTTLLRALAENTTKIRTLKLVFYSNPESQIFHALIYVIKLQERLRLFRIAGVYTEFHGIISALECQKNSLQEVDIQDCSFNAEFSVLNNCKNLETIRITRCNTELLKILDYKISTLEVVDAPIDAQTMALILEKAGILLQRLILESISIDENILDESLLLEAIKLFCQNITYFKIGCIEFSTQLLELIGNLHKLQFLSVWCYINIIPVEELPVEGLNIRVMQFSKILPLTLQYLDLRNIWLDPYIDILLNHCLAPLKKLLINGLDNEKNIKALIEFCARTKTLKYVGVREYSNLEALDDNIRKEVEANVALVPDHYIVVNC